MIPSEVVKALADGEAVKLKVKKAFDKETKKGYGDKPEVVQRVIFQIGGVDIFSTGKDLAGDFKDLEGQFVTLQASRTKYGLKGITMKEYTSKKGELVQYLSITKTCNIKPADSVTREDVEKKFNSPEKPDSSNNVPTIQKETDWDAKDLRIAKLSCISSAVDFWKSDDSKDTNFALETAQLFLDWVYAINDIKIAEPDDIHDIKERDAQVKSEDSGRLPDIVMEQAPHVAEGDKEEIPF